MPAYPWLFKREINTDYTAAKIRVLQRLNTPYPENYADIAVQDLEKQAKQIVESLKAQGIEQEDLEKKQITALIAYLQRLGTDAKPDNFVEKTEN
jgi:cytochrome c oxidase cbb3-type subunit I/II